MSKPVADFYDSHVDREVTRLDEPLCRIEFLSTWRLIEIHFPAHARVCDLGCGPGRYALELARAGHRVTLFDLSEQLLEKARAAFAQQHLTAERFLHGNARDAGALETGAFDAALLLGPMYHLVETPDRVRALRELHRILKPGGVALVAFLNSWGLVRTGIADFPDHYRDADFVRSMLGDLRFENEFQGFTECYWATPPSASKELTATGFEILTYIGAEGFAGGLRPSLERLAADDPAAYENAVRVAAETSELPQYRDACDHLHFVVRKAGE